MELSNRMSIYKIYGAEQRRNPFLFFEFQFIQMTLKIIEKKL